MILKIGSCSILPRFLPSEVISPGQTRVEDLLARAKRGSCRLFGSFMTRMELLYLIFREEGEEAARGALRLVESFTIEWITCEPSILEAAARLKARGRL